MNNWRAVFNAAHELSKLTGVKHYVYYSNNPISPGWKLLYKESPQEAYIRIHRMITERYQNGEFNE